jgi:hypothetical protein
VLVAVFNPTTGWAGRTITYDEARRQFVLQGHGHISAQSVLDYDAQGQIEWARAGLREWVRDVAEWERIRWTEAWGVGHSPFRGVVSGEAGAHDA